MLKLPLAVTAPLVLALQLGADAGNTPPSAPPVTRIARHGITWTFSGTVVAGRYLNGDWWVQAPATVVSVAPAPLPGRHGSMLDPRAGSAGRQHGQGYDDRIAHYDPARQVAFPLTLRAGDTLVSTESRTGGRVAGPYRGVTSQSFLAKAAILTCVAAPPPSDAFRPAYCGPKQTYRASQLRLDRLPALPRVATPLEPRSFVNLFERVWLDHVDGWEGRYLHPHENMPDYGREIALAVGEAGLLLLQDFPAADRAALLVPYLQLGIDLWGLVRDGQVWWGDGGHMQGRKWPIVFAGMLFDDPAMMRPGNGFSEDKQSYAERGWTAARALFRMRAADDHEESEPATWDPTERSYEEYRRCCTSYSWVGSALCAHIMGAIGEWDHEPFFHYVDRWMTPMHPPDRAATASVVGTYVSWFPHGYTDSTLVTRMWETYRGEFQPDGVRRVGAASRSELRAGVFAPLTPGGRVELHAWNVPAGAGVAVLGRPLPLPLHAFGGTLLVTPAATVPLPPPSHGKITLSLPVPAGGTHGVPVGVQMLWLDARAGKLEHSWAYVLER